MADFLHPLIVMEFRHDQPVREDRALVELAILIGVFQHPILASNVGLSSKGEVAIRPVGAKRQLAEGPERMQSFGASRLQLSFQQALAEQRMVKADLVAPGRQNEALWCRPTLIGGAPDTVENFYSSPWTGVDGQRGRLRSSEGNVFDGAHQGVFLQNRKPGAAANIVVRNNVFMRCNSWD